MIGRRKTDTILFFAAAWAILLWFTNMAVDYRILIPVAHISASEETAIIFILPTLTIIIVFGVSHLLIKSRDG